MDRATYIAGLRAIADLYEAHPEICTPTTDVELTNYSNCDVRDFARTARALGECEKQYGNTDMFLVKEIVPGFKLKFWAMRNRVCKLVKKIVPAHTVEVPEQEVEEWECGSLLEIAADGEAPALEAAADV